MAELKQIEVNGTTYDIGISGSEFPVVCETYSANTSGDTVGAKLAHQSPDNTHYQELSSNIFLKSVATSNGSKYSVVIAVSDADMS